MNDRLHQHLLDMLGAKDHDDAARIIATHHAREVSDLSDQELIADGCRKVFIKEADIPVFYTLIREFYAERDGIKDPAARLHFSTTCLRLMAALGPLEAEQ